MHRHRRAAPSSAIASSLDSKRLDRLLEPWVRDPEERAFVVRCIAGEGPVHHRAASYALLCLVGVVLERLGGAPPERAGETAPVPLRLAPHMARHDDDDAAFPLRLPLAPLELLAPKGSRELASLVDCLVDGPPHHALANAAMVCLLDAVLARLDGEKQ
jgi:hypothetical protein